MIDKIKIGWKEYDVVKIEPDIKLSYSEETCYGEIDYNKEIIRLNNNFNINQQKCTLIHEVLHGIEDVFDIELGEEKVTRLANALYTVLKDNNLVLATVTTKQKE